MSFRVSVTCFNEIQNEIAYIVVLWFKIVSRYLGKIRKEVAGVVLWFKIVWLIGVVPRQE